MSEQSITIGGASGFWGDASLATPQLLRSGKLDFIVYDYLAEITMSIMARARAADNNKGYAVDFIGAVLKPNLADIARQGVKVIANAGGVNVRACAEAARALIDELGLDLSVAVVQGDDLSDRAESFATAGATEMFSGDAFPPAESIASINAYLGAFPIARALAEGADIVITGRCVDSAVTLGACIYSFDWGPDDYDRLAAGSLAGHILECGTQATGGNYTDWESVVDSLPSAGYPMAEIGSDGAFVVTKPEGTGGTVTVGTVAEQMLYEIGDPQAYLLPDVACDFSEVTLEQLAEDRVRVAGARGHGAPDSYKVSATYADGYRAGQVWTMYGRDADTKAEKLAQLVFARTGMVLDAMGLPPLSETSVEVVGAEAHYGAAREIGAVREVDVKLAAKHPSAKGVGVFLKEMVGMALTAPPGLSGFAGARPKPSPVVRLFSMLVPKQDVPVTVESTAGTASIAAHSGAVFDPTSIVRPTQPEMAPEAEMVEVALEALAWGRSGDKGDKANIGVIARHPQFMPWIAASLTEQRVADFFAHFLAPGQARPVERFLMPGPPALNFLLHDVLGGGGTASLRTDPQGKGYAQLLLGLPVAVPAELARHHTLSIL